jgi:uncharacterized protein
MAKKCKENLCTKCPALCCHYITVEIDKPTNKRERDDLRWYLLHEGISLLIEEERWLLQCTTKCIHLQDDHQCGIYETRPETCRIYSNKNCDYHTLFLDWDTEYILIDTYEQFEEYRQKQKAEKKAAKAAKKEKKQKKLTKKPKNK